jgi:hypothetical protein
VEAVRRVNSVEGQSPAGRDVARNGHVVGGVVDDTRQEVANLILQRELQAREHCIEEYDRASYVGYTI